MLPLRYCFSTSWILRFAAARSFSFSAGMSMSSLEIEIPARVASRKPRSFIRSRISTVRSLPTAR